MIKKQKKARKSNKNIKKLLFLNDKPIKSNKMNKTELIKALADLTGKAQTETKQFLEAFTETLTEALSKGESITLVGFGTFSILETKARTGRNPQTGKPIQIKAKKKVRFKAGSDLTEKVN